MDPLGSLADTRWVPRFYLGKRMDDFSSGQKSETTCAQFEHETEACKFFDEVVGGSGLFTIHHEVKGFLEYRHHWKNDGDVRIDRILSPAKGLWAKWWDMGFVGVEIKRSGKKIGPPLAQAMDYLDSVWFITPAKLAINISHAFLFPCGELFNTAGSFCAQHHLGQVDLTRYKIHFRSGQHTIFYYNITTGKVTCNGNRNGKKVGSR
jgi:hypothetical protein